MHLLYILERPIQNDLPYQLIAKEKNIAITVLCIEQTNGQLAQNENINQSVFTDNLLYTFPYQFLNDTNSLATFIKQADVIVIYGHFHPVFRKAILLARFFRKKLILTSDASGLQGLAGSSGWKLKLKPALFRLLYNQISDAIFVPSNASKKFFQQIGIKQQKIILTPYTVNEEFIQNALQNSDVAMLRESLGIRINDTVFMFCGKLIQRKRAEDLLHAFAKINKLTNRVIIVGDGPLRLTLEALATELNIRQQVVFTGLVPYNELPSYYALASVLVIPAEHEPYGLPVNEAMICGTPVIASNAVGAAGDLIEEGATGYIYPVADIDALSSKMKLFIDSPKLKTTLSNNCQLKMKSWNSQSNVTAQVEFFKSKGWLS
ncbi:MAG: glycosyltransferase family 4 protein [Sediminibacterium sp.]|nr:glycosyltransferase family 4 protein [Sediminibacterium sp.]